MSAERERAEKLQLKMDRVAYLAGWYGDPARVSGNADLAELVAELDRLVHGPVPVNTYAEPGATNPEGVSR